LQYGGKAAPPWVNAIILGEKFGVLPQDAAKTPLTWVARISAYYRNLPQSE